MTPDHTQSSFMQSLERHGYIVHRIGACREEERLYGVIYDYNIARRKFNEYVEHFVRENPKCTIAERSREFVKIILLDKRQFFFALKPLRQA